MVASGSTAAREFEPDFRCRWAAFVLDNAGDSDTTSMGKETVGSIASAEDRSSSSAHALDQLGQDRAPCRTVVAARGDRLQTEQVDAKDTANFC